jgi:hypothetical protein
MMHMIGKISKLLDALDDITPLLVITNIRAVLEPKPSELTLTMNFSMIPLRTIFLTLAFTLFDVKPTIEPILL